MKIDKEKYKKVKVIDKIFNKIKVKKMKFDKEEWKKKLEERLLEKFSVSLKDATPFEVYRALGETVMSFIAKDWYKTKQEYSKTKQAFYLSSEFLMGRALGNNLIKKLKNS